MVLRLVFHDSGTYNAAAQNGGANASIQHELDRPENFGLKRGWKVIQTAMSNIQGTPAEGLVSYADMVALVGAYAVAMCGGPTISIPIGGPDLDITCVRNISFSIVVTLSSNQDNSTACIATRSSLTSSESTATGTTPTSRVGISVTHDVARCHAAPCSKVKCACAFAPICTWLCLHGSSSVGCSIIKEVFLQSCKIGHVTDTVNAV